MNWINNVVRPKIRRLLTTRREPPDDFWKKCGGCGQMSDRKALEDNKFVFACCGHHEKVDADRAPEDAVRRGRVQARSRRPRWRSIRSNSATASAIPTA